MAGRRSIYTRKRKKVSSHLQPPSQLHITRSVQNTYILLVGVVDFLGGSEEECKVVGGKY
jgi:hypothetical protein